MYIAETSGILTGSGLIEADAKIARQANRQRIFINIISIYNTAIEKQQSCSLLLINDLIISKLISFTSKSQPHIIARIVPFVLIFFCLKVLQQSECISGTDEDIRLLFVVI